MSKETAREFLRQTRIDEELREGFESQKTLDSIVAYASENGYEFTTEELHETTMDIYEQEGVELTEEQLESAAGGYCCMCTVSTTWNCGGEEEIEPPSS